MNGKTHWPRWSVATLLAITFFTANAEPIDNFQLLDHTGRAHDLYYHSDADAIVIMIQGNGCPVVRNALVDYKTLRDRYAGKNIRFFLLNSNLQDDRKSVRKEAEKWDIDMPILLDEGQLIGESLNLIRTAEVLVIDPKQWRIVFRGPLNDRFFYERQKTKASKYYAADAIDAVLAGEPVAREKVGAIGCLINFPGRNADHSKISYSERIAPLLQQHCVTCHREGGTGPWAMDHYNKILGFAPMIREVLRTKRMPPWDADPHIGSWRDDRGLPTAAMQDLVHWIEAGAPRGDGPDPLAEQPPQVPDWPLGPPDLIIDIPAFTVPASGEVDYQYPIVSNPLPHDAWIRAASVLPGEPEVVHHLLAGTQNPNRPESAGPFDNYIIGYAPGNESAAMPDGTGVYLPKGSKLIFQMHYTPVGRELTDQSKLGLYFHKQPPDNFLRHQIITDPLLNIPPHAKWHEENAYYQFERKATLHALLVHAHYRAVAATFELAYPDGKVTTLLSVPDYDFNWQRTYDLAEPLSVPAGAKLIHRVWYDNSAQNPGNPDPTRTIPWGIQSRDEMLYGGFNYSWTNETTTQPLHDDELSGSSQFFGFLDADMDEQLTKAELPTWMDKHLAPGFAAVDTDRSGGISIAEFYTHNLKRQ